MDERKLRRGKADIGQFSLQSSIMLLKALILYVLKLSMEFSMNKISMLKHSILACALALASGSALAADVGVSISVGQPGFYGRIDIGEFPYPAPRVIYREPIIVHRHIVETYEPIYLRVPPGHAKYWSRYCDRYHACGRPVYFVQERWYRDDYVPYYHEYHNREYREYEHRGYEGQGYRGRGDDDHDQGNRGRGHGNGHNKHNNDRR